MEIDVFNDKYFDIKKIILYSLIITIPTIFFYFKLNSMFKF